MVRTSEILSTQSKLSEWEQLKHAEETVHIFRSGAICLLPSLRLALLCLNVQPAEHIVSQHFDVILAILEPRLFCGIITQTENLSSPLLSSPLLSSCRWTSISSSPPHISFLPHSESWPPEWVSRAGTRWGYTACVRLLFIYLISEDALTVTLQLFRHMAPSGRHEKSFQIWWETEVFGDVMQ